jgi:hypothetical protein
MDGQYYATELCGQNMTGKSMAGWLLVTLQSTHILILVMIGTERYSIRMCNCLDFFNRV